MTLYFNSFCVPPRAQKKIVYYTECNVPYLRQVYAVLLHFEGMNLTWVCNLDSGSPRTRVPFLENDFRATRLSDTSRNGEHELQNDEKIFRT